MRLQKQLEEKDLRIKQLLEGEEEKKKEIEKLKYFIERTEKDRELLEREMEKKEAKHKTCKIALAKYLKILQDNHNREKKAKIAKKSVSIGQMLSLIHI